MLPAVVHALVAKLYISTDWSRATPAAKTTIRLVPAKSLLLPQAGLPLKRVAYLILQLFSDTYQFVYLETLKGGSAVQASSTLLYL